MTEEGREGEERRGEGRKRKEKGRGVGRWRRGEEKGVEVWRENDERAKEGEGIGGGKRGIERRRKGGGKERGVKRGQVDLAPSIQTSPS